ncbi:hypothetical protein NBRC116586_00080 [Pseudooceanicola nitratireducens]|uniref:HesA/MoeB/ThiF family protein n=1 Tax=Pseudooceanicola nitratireducens TaxID=517719 RepID=UPI0031064000
MNRYARQMILPEVGAGGQVRLASARVLVVGAGGLGATLLPLLAGAGVGLAHRKGEIRIFDPDRVEEHNLHRQILFRQADLGRPKAQVTAEALVALNPDVAIRAECRAMDPEVAREAVRHLDLVIDAADNFAVSYALSDACHLAQVPLVSASVLGRQGYAGAFCGSGPSLRALFPDLPGQAQTCATGGVMGPAVAMLGALQAQMALSLLLGHEPSPLGRLMSVDLASWRVTTMSFAAASEPAQIPAVIAASEVAQGDLFVDLTADGGLGQGRRPKADQRVVFQCVTGLRAWRAARQLIHRGHQNVAICTAPMARVAE